MIHTYGPYPNGKKNRLIMVFWDSDANTHTSQSYPRYLMEIELNRRLEEWEEVHHLDENPLNNEISNLKVLTNEEHRLAHGKLLPRPCLWCDTPTTNKYFCSQECRAIGTRRVERPNSEQLAEDISKMPFTQIGRKYGVSDNAVRKWARKYELL